MTKEDLEQFAIDKEGKKENHRLNEELKKEQPPRGQESTEHYGEPGTTKFLFFPGEGNLQGTFDQFSTWIANNGRSEGKTKGFIRKALAKEREAQAIQDLTIMQAKKGFTKKTESGTPGTQRELHFRDDVKVMGTYDIDGVWHADVNTPWAGRTKGSIARKNYS